MLCDLRERFRLYKTPYRFYPFSNLNTNTVETNTILKTRMLIKFKARKNLPHLKLQTNVRTIVTIVAKLTIACKLNYYSFSDLILHRTQFQLNTVLD